jgi:hypothetical protein
MHATASAIRPRAALAVASWRKPLVLIGQGSLIGVLLVLLAQSPRWLALWEALQYAPVTNAREPSGQAAGPSPLQDMPLTAWRQKIQHVPDELAAPALWRHWRQQHERLGLRVEQWQRMDSVAPIPAWPLVVQRARMELQGDWAAWQRLWQELPGTPGLWRLDQLQIQSAPAPGAPARLRWQAHWSLALRAAPAGSVPATNLTGFEPAPPAEPASERTAATPPGQSKPPVQVSGAQVTDWPLNRLRWVGWWTVGHERTALFLAEGRLFSVRAGEAVGSEGHRWVGGDDQQLWLRARSAGGVSPEPVNLTLGSKP